MAKEKNSRITVRRAHKAELPEAIEVLAQAFAQDRAVRSIMAHTHESRDNLEFARALYEIQIYGHYYDKGEVDVAIEDGKILGVGLWAKPGKQMPTWKFVSLLLKYLKLFRGAAAFAARRELCTDSAHPGFKHWYLFAIAVSPDAQGKGIGSTMLRHGLERADQSPVYLEASTPGSAALYRSLGFVELGPIVVPGDKLSDPPEIAMWRPRDMI